MTCNLALFDQKEVSAKGGRRASVQELSNNGNLFTEFIGNPLTEEASFNKLATEINNEL